MKSILSCLTVISVLTLVSCGGSSTKEAKSNADSTKTNSSNPPASQTSGPTLTITEADWELRDLSKIAQYINVTMKVPKNAKVENNNNVGVKIIVNPHYTINVVGRAEQSIKEAMEFDKYAVKDTTNSNGKILKEEANGMIYTFQIPSEANGTKYEPEVHFAYYVGQPGNLYAISDDFLSADTTNEVNGSYYSEEAINKIYAIIKGSAKVNN